MPYAAQITDFALFQQELVGTWSNQSVTPDNSLSYNVMPLPQSNATNGYILKNFKYTEKIQFHRDDTSPSSPLIPSAALAPNRGGTINQNVYAIFYDQEVRFADVKKHTGEVVHIENGAWLYLERFDQGAGTFPPLPGSLAPVGQGQVAEVAIAKQISVPHGNSVLALGAVDGQGSDHIIPYRPVIPDAPLPYPTPVKELLSQTAPPALNVGDYARNMNPNNVNPRTLNTDKAFCLNTNLPLQRAVTNIDPDGYIHWHVTTEPLQHGQGSVTNIPFEQRKAKVTTYWADYWLLGKRVKHRKGATKNTWQFDDLMYTQTMLMEMIVNGYRYTFPHVTCNVLKRAPSSVTPPNKGKGSAKK